MSYAFWFRPLFCWRRVDDDLATSSLPVLLSTQIHMFRKLYLRMTLEGMFFFNKKILLGTCDTGKLGLPGSLKWCICYSTNTFANDGQGCSILNASWNDGAGSYFLKTFVAKVPSKYEWSCKALCFVECKVLPHISMNQVFLQRWCSLQTCRTSPVQYVCRLLAWLVNGLTAKFELIDEVPSCSIDNCCKCLCSLDHLWSQVHWNHFISFFRIRRLLSPTLVVFLRHVRH